MQPGLQKRVLHTDDRANSGTGGGLATTTVMKIRVYS